VDKIAYLLLAACVFFMNTQKSIPIPAGKQPIYLGIVDILIWIAFAVWALSVILKRSILRIKWPPLASIALPAIAVISAIKVVLAGGNKPDAAKEVFQIVEYFIIASVLMVNLMDTRARLRGVLSVFLLAASAVVAWGLIDYAARPDAFFVGGAHNNMNVLGTYLGLTLPFILGIALFDDIQFRHRLALIILVIAALPVIMSGAALAATLASILLLLAMRSPRLMLPLALVLLVPAVILLPAHLRENHRNVVLSSVAVYLDNNYLLGEQRLLERAHKLVDEERYADARRVLIQLESAGKLNEDGRALLDVADEKLAGTQPPDSVLPADGNGNPQPVVAMRYKCWQASLRAAIDHPWGAGPGAYQKAIGPYFGKFRQFTYDSDEPEVFNLGFAQPDGYNQFLVTAVELGLPGLLAFVWFYVWGLSRSINLYSTAWRCFSRGIAAGALASLAFLPVLAAYSGIMVRGVALPFIFIVLCVHLADKTEKETI